MKLLAIAISLVVKADAFSPPLHACGKLRSSILLLASIDKDACDDKIFEGLNITCGPGFKRIEGAVDPAVRTTLMLSPPNYPLAQIHAMEREQCEIQSVAKQAIVDEREKQQQKQVKSLKMLQSFMGSLFTDTCQSNFDCNSPQVCCDFRFKKICCDEGGTKRDIENELALIPVPQKG
eukprot:scaffold1605_cov114-Skeletonema_menzelii.AAC.3